MTNAADPSGGQFDKGRGVRMPSKADGQNQSKKKTHARALAKLSATALTPLIVSPWVRAGLATAASLLQVDPATIVRDLLSEFIETWRAELGRRLEASGYHPQYLSAQSFTQLLVLTVEAAVKEPSEAKRRMYARILARSDTPEWGKKAHRVHEILRVLNTVMTHFEEIDRTAPKHPTEEEHRELYRVSVEQVGLKLGDGPALSTMARNVYLKRLERLGLLMELPLISADVDRATYIPTHILEDLMQILLVDP